MITSHFSRRAAKIATALAAGLALAATGTVTVPAQAGADQLANDRAEASELAARISVLGQREAALGEQYDAGVATLDAANARVASASRAFAGARAEQAKTVSLLQQDALLAYVGGGPQAAISGPLTATDVNTALLRQELAATFASQQSDDLDSYRLAADNATIARLAFVSARDVDERQLARLERDREEVQAAQDQLVALESQVKGNIAVLVAQIQRAKMLAEQRAEAALLAAERAKEEAQAAAEAREQAEQEAAARAAAAAETTTTAAGTQSAGFVPTTSQAIPGVSAAASVAVAAAESRVGDPYVWGAAGPDAFDCSGLVMWAYAQAGVYLPHYSGAQYADTVAIPMSDLEPGDLVFPADPGQHVAMYVGNGMIVQAPYTGANVEVVALTSFFVLASRVG